MKRLQHRVRRVGTAHKQAMNGYTPVPAASQVTGSAASPPAPGVMPLAQVVVYPEPGGQYVTVGYKGLVPLFTGDGAAVPATSPGRWGQLAAAGRAR